MSDDPLTPRLAAALAPLTERVRTDVTAKRSNAGRMSWTREPLTPELLLHHLNGGPARGVCSISAGGSTTELAVLDFDSHGGETDWPTMSKVVAQVVDVLETAYGMEPILFRSSGGRGVHVYLLWDTPQDAYSVRAWLAEVLKTCGLKSGAKGVSHGQVEIFPKQDEVAFDGFGNQFILPLSRESLPLALRDDTDDEDLSS